MQSFDLCKLKLNRCNIQDNMQCTVAKTKGKYNPKQIEEWPMETEKGTNIKNKLLKGEKLK